MKRLKLFVNGQWTEPIDDQYFSAYNPATEEVIAQVAQGSRKDAQRAVASAKSASREFREWSIWKRAELLQRIATVVEKRKEELAYLLTIDQGKPYHTEALREVDSVVRAFSDAAEQIKWMETSFIPTRDEKKRVYNYLAAKGVYAVITPWNYPYMVPTEFLAPGLAAGNTIVWVPAPTTSVCAVKFAECLEEAGVPPGVVNLITGFGDEVGDEIVIHPNTDAIAFCGSTKTGQVIASRGAGKPMLLELGGNGPTIVLADANIEQAAQSIAKACFTNAGQICSSTERILVQKEVQDELVERLLEQVKSIILGDPLDSKTTMGPLNNPPVVDKNIEHAEDSRKRGSTIVTGGKKPTHFEKGYYFEPTIINNVKLDSLYNLDETFGPVAPVIPFESLDEALEITYQSKWGLSSAIFSQHLKTALTFAEKMPTGLVNINDNSDYWEPHLPFGGVAGKTSGLGRVGGKYAIREMSDLKTITIDLK
ncbi:succinate-semialdehyde dehydrogenase / glutarate-semialdehyde dehydrogenase [Seinonella peptonophila]|uniref:Succinate-semialdehyde dehydrogenase / glutarate-semialdehyde dehydrogenase n=1 Tax=Seinonella peptonophila TaxID=112248 RepID=A0A1M4SK88_9BACL|nr:aldehyde dehydrogenase family protein [Seinonella peptonophila]SHE32620.1 succinate-semialdehyde dehydrogenase / glutarate-semialdehyde dehydrogenase [Seinonella peptonophila]